MAPGQEIALPQVTVRAVPSATKMSVKDCALPVGTGFETVKVVMFAFSATSKTLAVERLRVSVPPDIEGDAFISP